MVRELGQWSFTSEKKEKVMNPLEVKARDYFSIHRIEELFEHLTSLLLLHRPENPTEFIIGELSRFKETGSCRGTPGLESVS